MVHYGNDTTLVDQLIARKEREGLVQNHPEIEGVKMYWVLWMCFVGIAIHSKSTTEFAFFSRLGIFGLLVP